MTRIKRQHLREPVDFELVVYWEFGEGQVGSCRPRARDLSDGGMRLQSPIRIEPGMHVFLDVSRPGFPLEGAIRYCVPDGGLFRVGLEFLSTAKPSAGASSDIDYYEVFQLSPKADLETIHRVYRLMAARYHPDNLESGDHEKFLQLSDAYAVLTDSERRSQYDARRSEEKQPGPLPLFQAKAFVDDKEGEANRRLGVLCLLYAQRRRDTRHPSISLLVLEETMGIPREHLEFTLWYLKQKRYVETSDGADYSLTVDGVDFVEEHAPAQSILTKLLQAAPSSGPGPVPVA